MAPRYSPELAMLYEREKQKGNVNRATLAVARSWCLPHGGRPWAAEFSGGGDE